LKKEGFDHFLSQKDCKDLSLYGANFSTMNFSSTLPQNLVALHRPLLRGNVPFNFIMGNDFLRYQVRPESSLVKRFIFLLSKYCMTGVCSYLTALKPF
jgi:hypothetical protein